MNILHEYDTELLQILASRIQQFMEAIIYHNKWGLFQEYKFDLIFKNQSI